MNNNLIEIQKMLMSQMKRLDDDNIMKKYGKEEVARGNSLSLNAATFIKTVNIGLRIIEMSKKHEISADELSIKTGIKNEK